MALTTPPLGYPVPTARHAVSVQLPTWSDMCDFAAGDPRVKSAQRTGYPRSFLHKDVVEVVTTSHAEQERLFFTNLIADVSYRCPMRFSDASTQMTRSLSISVQHRHQHAGLQWRRMATRPQHLKLSSV